MENTTYLHNHSVYSLFDGAQTIKEMVERAKLLGCKNLALTDHGTMMGIPKFVAECRKNEIKPLIGVEIYMQNPDDEIDGISIINKGHSCLYAVNDEGYKQLCHIMSDSEKKQIRIGKSVYPITTFEILKKYVKRGDLIYTTACVGGYIPQILYFNKKQEEKISEINERLSKCNSPEDAGYKLLCSEISDIQNKLYLFADDKKLIQKRTKQTYKKQEKAASKLTGEDKEIALKNIESIKAGIESAKKELEAVNDEIKNLKSDLSAKNKEKTEQEKTHKVYNRLKRELEECMIIDEEKINAFADSRLVYLADIFGKENTYVEIQYHGLDMEDYTFNRMISLAEKHGLKPNNELAEMLSHVYKKKSVIDAIKNTDELAARCDVKYDFGSHPPMFPNVPAGMTASEYLKLKSDKGKKERYPEGVSNEDEARYNHELDVITSMGYADYHLIVQDYIKKGKSFGKDTDYNVGPGRGSAAGSMVCYCLGK